MTKYLKKHPLESILWLISALIIASGSIYKLYSLNLVGIIVSLLLALVLWVFFIKIIAKKEEDIPTENRIKEPLKLPTIILAIIYILLSLAAFYVLYRHRSGSALVSPWTVTPDYFFLIYFILTGILLLLIKLKKNNPRNQVLILTLFSLHYLLSFSVAVLIYRIGYGYDPFVHQSTMDLIDRQGSVTPKPFYYLGYYGLLTVIHKITSISLVWLDKLAVPVLAAAFLPLAFFRLGQKYWPEKNNSLIMLLLLLMIPFGLFILSTPQNLAWLFLLLSICFGLINFRISLLLALATLTLHPLAGIPALILASSFGLSHYQKKIKAIWLKLLNLTLFLGASLALPIAFLASGQAKLNWSLSNYQSFLLALSPSLSLPGKESWILNLAYFYGNNIHLIIIILVIFGCRQLYKKHHDNSKLAKPLFLAIALIFSYLFLSQLSFNLISYEQNDFAERLLLAAMILLLPLMALGLAELNNRIRKQGRPYRLIMTLALLLAITASLYFSYPRQDNYHSAKAYAVSQSDLEAVEWIENQTTKPYIVLANQQTSAMALRQFGFGRYYGGQYFYPIPTSSPLYQYFLDMVYQKADRATMEKAMDLGQVDEAYFILPKYWWAFPKVLAEAKLSADSWEKIGSGQLYVFKYSRRP